MRRPRIILCTAITCVILVACAWLTTPRSTRAAVAADPVILDIVGKNQKITVTATGTGARYSVQRDGVLVADRVSLDELRTIDPHSYQQIKSATVGSSGVWAGLD